MKEKELTWSEIEAVIPDASAQFTLHKSKERFNIVNGQLARVSKHLWTDLPGSINPDYEAAQFGLLRLKQKQGTSRFHEVHLLYARIAQSMDPATTA